MSTVQPALPDLAGPAVVGRSGRLATTIAAWTRRLADSEYVRVGSSRRFHAVQRRRARAAGRMGLLFLAAAVAFDALALLGLDTDNTVVVISIDASVMAMAVVGWWSLGGPLRRYPDVVEWVVLSGLSVSTVATGTAIPALAVQSLGYLLVLPGLVALLLPWGTRMHVRWLLVQAATGSAFLAVGPLTRFSADERGDLVVVLAIALGASLTGHLLLKRARIRDFAQIERIRSLRRQTDSALVELERAHHTLELTARTDPLTGAGNRRRLEEDLRAVRAHVSRSGFTYGLAVFDLDRFKSINDGLGHAAGDAVLQRVAEAIRQSLRAEDAIYRLGGDEFLALLHAPSIEAVATAAERLRSVVLALDIEHPDNVPHGVLSLSVGATLITPADVGLSNEDLIARADDALYEAKRGGRNRVCLPAA